MATPPGGKVVSTAKIFTTMGAALGIIGGTLVSYQMIEGFYVWLVGNTVWIISGFILRDWGIIFQFSFFQFVSINGIYQWGK